MLGLRVLANPDEFMDMGGIFGHNPFCEAEPVLGARSIEYVTFTIEEHRRGDGRGRVEEATATSEDNYLAVGRARMAALAYSKHRL